MAGSPCYLKRRPGFGRWPLVQRPNWVSGQLIIGDPVFKASHCLRSVGESGVRRDIHRSRMADFSHFKSSFIQKSRSSLCRIEQLVQVSRVDNCLQPVKRAFDGQFQRDVLWVAHWLVVVHAGGYSSPPNLLWPPLRWKNRKQLSVLRRGRRRWKHRMSWNQSDLSPHNADWSWHSWQHQIGTNRAIS